MPITENFAEHMRCAGYVVEYANSGHLREDMLKARKDGVDVPAHEWPDDTELIAAYKSVHSLTADDIREERERYWGHWRKQHISSLMAGSGPLAYVKNFRAGSDDLDGATWEELESEVRDKYLQELMLPNEIEGGNITPEEALQILKDNDERLSLITKRPRFYEG